MVLDIENVRFSPSEYQAERIMVVDDEATMRSLLEQAIQGEGMEVDIATCVQEARELLQKKKFNLVITDVVMPEENGIDLLRWTREQEMDTPFIIMTGRSDVELVVDALNLGAYSFIKKPFLLNTMFDTISAVLAKQRYERVEKEFQDHLAHTNTMLRQKVIDAVVKHETLFLGALSALAQTIDARDPYTQQHSASVAKLSVKVADAMGLDYEVQNTLDTAGGLHDIGKIGVPESILIKPSKLDDAEYEVMKQHPLKAAQILEPVPGLEDTIPAIRAHHERYDGGGYPDGLSGEGIPLLARIMAVCDTWDAMTSDRVYRKALPKEKAVAIIEEEKGRQFDPEIATVFLKLVAENKVKPSNEKD